MRMERGQKPKNKAFPKAQKAPFVKMQESSKELKWNLGRRCIYLLEIAFPVCSRANQAGGILMQEMPDAGENHGHSEPVGGGNHVFIADRAAGLNDGNGTRFGGFFDAVGEREKGV
jgi:hypothetical protein